MINCLQCKWEGNKRKQKLKGQKGRVGKIIETKGKKKNKEGGINRAEKKIVIGGKHGKRQIGKKMKGEKEKGSKNRRESK